MNFVIANEDHNAYTFDMRKLARARTIHKDHVGAVMDVSFSPTGRVTVLTFFVVVSCLSWNSSSFSFLVF